MAPLVIASPCQVCSQEIPPCDKTFNKAAQKRVRPLFFLSALQFSTVVSGKSVKCVVDSWSISGPSIRLHSTPSKMSSLYPSLEDMKVDHMMKVQ